MKMKNNHRVSDLGLAAALVSLDFEISKTEQDKTGRTEFIFTSPDEQGADLDSAISSYWSNTLDVKARYYFDAIKMLKSRIYGGK